MVLLLNTWRFYLRITVWMLPPVSFALLWMLRLPAFDTVGGSTFMRPAWLVALTFLAWLPVSRIYRLDSVAELLGERTGTRVALAAVASTCGLDLLAFFLFGVALRLAFFLLSALLLLFLTIAVRTVFRLYARRRLGSGRPRLRVLLAGTDEFAHLAARSLREAPFGGCRIVAWLRLPGQPITIEPEGAPILEFHDLAAFDPGEIDDVVIALPPALLNRVQQVAQLCDPLCRPVRAIVDLGGAAPATTRIFQFGQLQMIDLGETPAESPRYAIFKRLFDIVFSLCVLLLAAPLMLAIAAAIKLSSPGPVLFRQSRVGLNSRNFDMLKFRTMQVAAAAESDTRWTTAADPRRTAIGVFLRRSSLDELPQFLNVLRGEMSVVGPRPERPHFVSRFRQDIAEYHRRHRLQVGITGWAQVNGLRGDTSIRRRIDYDLDYLKNWSLAFDLRIIARTVWSGFFGSNAY